MIYEKKTKSNPTLGVDLSPCSKQYCSLHAVLNLHIHSTAPERKHEIVLFISKYVVLPMDSTRIDQLLPHRIPFFHSNATLVQFYTTTLRSNEVPQTNPVRCFGLQ